MKFYKLMKNLDKIVCLHCIEDKERFEYISGVLRELDLLDITYISEFTKLETINLKIGNSLPQLKTVYYDSFGGEIYNSVFSCMYNWLQLISQSKAKYNSIICIEDDIEFHCSKQELESVLDQIPDDADIVLLGYGFIPYYINGKDIYLKFRNSQLFTKLNQQFKLAGMFAVWMNQKGMDYYLKYVQDKCCCSDVIWSDIDNDLQREMNVNIYICNKPTINPSKELPSVILKQ